MRVIIMNGSGGSGKDSLVTLCRDSLKNYEVLNLSTIDEVKKIAEDKFGWDLEKNEKGRQLLSDLKKAWTNYNGGPARQLFGTVLRHKLEEDVLNKKYIIFIHSREPEEIEQFIEDFAAEGIPTAAALVRRNEVQTFYNDSDLLVENYEYDFYIDNNGDWNDLVKISQNFSQKIIEWNEELWPLNIK